MYCKVRDKKCEDYTTESSCEGDSAIGVKDQTKCSWNNSYYQTGRYCKEYGIDSKCTVTKGSCKGSPSEGKVCLFDIQENKCSEKVKKCENYYEKCYENFPIDDADENQKSQCIKDADNDYCRTIEIDQYCKVNNNGLCVSRKTFDQKDGICSFDDDNKKKCTRITRKCTQYTEDSCNNLANCIYDKGQCFEIDDYCTMNNGDCKEKNPDQKQAGKKCIYDSTNLQCKKGDMICKDYDQNKCKDYQYPQSENKQCIKRDNSCVEIQLDGNCKVNDNDECIPVDSNKISDHEICAFAGSSQLKCLKREKICSDIASDQCETYKPIAKLCYKIDDSDVCEQVRVDSQCKMNDENKCTGSGCSLKKDDDKIYHCSYTEDKGGDSSFVHFVQLKRFMLLLLVLML